MSTPILPSASAPAAPLVEGARVGTYEIVSRLGEGGMGIVYVARHVHLKTRAVIKVLQPEIANDAGHAARFVNEARAASILKHRNIVTVYDCWQEAGRWFIALEFLDGGPLSGLIASTNGPNDLATIVLVVCQAANGLHVAHQAGIVHRDIKPDNLFLTQTATNPHHVTILDFGIAKMAPAAGGVNTRTNMAIGTPTYMAPEQLRASKDIDGRADVYALGVIAWEMSTGVRLWGDTTAAPAILEQQITGGRPTNPCAVRPELPAAWGAVISRALAVDPGARWPSAKEFAQALAHAAPGTEWTENGIEILRRHANELMLIEQNAETAGRAGGAPISHVDAPTIRNPTPSAGRDVGAIPIVAHTPSPGFTARPATHPTVPDRPAVVPAAPHEPTTLSTATGQAAKPPARARKLAAVVAAVAGLGVVAAIVGVLASGGNDAGPRGAADPAGAPASLPATSALEIVTDPTGAAISIDSAARGASPVNIAAPVGADLEIRAELAGHELAIERVRVGAAPATVRVTLRPLVAVDAGPGAPDAAPAADARDAKPRDRRGGRRAPGSGSNFDPDDVVGE